MQTMAPSHKFRIFLILSSACLVQSELGLLLKSGNEERFDFRHNQPGQSIINEPGGNGRDPPGTSCPQTTTKESSIPPPSMRYHLIFRLSDVGLLRVGQDFIISHDVISLSLDNNEIKEISPFAFRRMHNLRHLNLSGNKIPKQNLLMLAGISKLQTLIIDNNNPSDSKGNLLKEHEVLENLQHLHMCNSQLGNFQVPFVIATPILTHLHLSNNSISSSNNVFNNIPNSLTHLHLDDNLIDRVDQDKLRNLQELIMDNNIVTTVCFDNCDDQSLSLKGAVRMQNLSLSKNMIAEVSPNAFSDTKNLLNLDLSGNKITDLAKSMFNHTIHITKLSLADNILATIPDVCPITYLKSLNLTGNRISVVFSSSFCVSRSLEYLYMANNVISTIELRAFMNLQNLKYLDLSGNRLRQLPTHWAPSWSLHELHVERNLFTNVDDLGLINLKSLRNVYVSENPIRRMKMESLQPLHSIAYLTLHLMTTYPEDKQCNCNNDDENENDEEDDNNGDSGYNISK